MNKHFCLAIDIVNLGVVVLITPYLSDILYKFLFCFPSYT